MGSSSSPELHERHTCLPHTSADGQPDGGLLHQPHGGDKVNSTSKHSLPVVRMVPGVLDRGMTLSSEYLLGAHEIADKESRTLQSSAELKLKMSIFLKVMSLYGPFEVDLFASRLNNQLPQWRPNPYSLATDAFQTQWTNLKGYAFPPFALIGRCLRKLRQEGSAVVLVAPVWSSQTWYPWLLEVLTAYPVLLPTQRDLLKDRDHPLLVRAVWKVSGISAHSQAFLGELRRSSRLKGTNSAYQSDGLAGVIKGLSIPFHAMSSTFWTS